MYTQVTIQEIPKIQLAGISHIGEFEKAANMFQRLMEWGYQRNIIASSGFKAITIYHDNPNVTKTSKVRFSACITTNKRIKQDDDIRQIDLKKGVYAVGHFEIKGEEISTAWKNMCVWVIENGYEFRDGDYFEMYRNDHRTHPELKFILDICIPLERTKSIKIKETSLDYFSNHEEQIGEGEKKLDYFQLIDYMKELRAFFHNEYKTYFKLGKIYQGNPDYSYFSLATEELKREKLKFVIILDHKLKHFSICLSGQNKKIRKNYWNFFSSRNLNKYHLAESIDESLSIIDHVILEDADFTNRRNLTEQIEKEALKFIKEIEQIID